MKNGAKVARVAALLGIIFPQSRDDSTVVPSQNLGESWAVFVQDQVKSIAVIGTRRQDSIGGIFGKSGTVNLGRADMS
jgi:hypothetical protein